MNQQMKKVEQLTLIDGNFNDEEAKEILMNILTTKIHFHEMKDFSSQERFGIQDETAKKRIPALKKEIEKLLQILSEAKLHNKKLSIDSIINISISVD
jgi:hypothetical protein